MTFDPQQVVKIRYTNYRGETAIRRIVPREVRFVSTDWHPGAQWILEALDVDKGAERSFAMKDISEWHPESAIVCTVTNGVCSLERSPRS